MATYTSKEMNGSGSLGGELSGTQIFTITNPLNSLNNRNTGYLTLEGNATANQNLSITTYLTGAFSAFNGVSDRGLVYNSTATHWSISVAGSGGSFAFTPTNDIAADSYYIKSTGLFSLTVESDVEERFVMSVRIGESAPEGMIEDETFTLPWIGTYDVDWGDGTKQTGVTDSQTHTYATSGDYDIKVKAATGRIYFNNSGDKSKVIDIKNWGTCIWTSMQVAFAGCDNLTTINSLDTPDLSSVTNMANMFRDARNLSTIQNINSWNISNVQNIGFIFGRTNFNQDIGGWDTSNVTDMSGVFWVNTQFNHNVGNWNTSNVTNVYKMFDNNKMNHSLAGWDISNITNFGGFMTNNTNLSPENYDATLISWASQSPQPNVNIAFRSKHTYRAASAMQTLIDTYGWTITDGGQLEVNDETYFSINTTKGSYLSSDSDQFKLRLINETVNLLVEWGDGTIDTITSYDQPEITHTYPSSGIYNVKITTSSPYTFLFNNGGDRNKMLDIKNWGNLRAVSGAFFSCFNLTVSATDAPVIPGPSLAQCFRACYNLSDIDVSAWDLSNVNRLNVMFNGSSNVDTSFANWDINQVIDFSNFLPQATLSTSNYNETLISWAAQSPQINKSISFGNSQYSYEAAAARQSLIDDYGWTITDGGQGVAPEFAIRVQTDATGGISQDNQFTIPTFSGEVYNYIIETSDGQTLTNNTGDTTITFPSSGIYDIKITGLFPRIYFNNVGDGDKLLSILNWGTQQWSSFAKAFSGCIRLDYVDSVSVPDLTNVTDLSQCFNLCNVLGQTQGTMDWTGWDVSNVLTFGNGFIKRYNTSVNDDFTGWSFGIGANLAGAVSNTDRNQAILTNWNLSNVTSIESVFFGYDVARELIGLETWNTTTITNMKNLFFRGDMISFGSLANWDLSNVTTFSGMFFGYNATLTDADSINSINNLDVSNATDLSNMFGYGNNVLPLVNLSNWNVSNATNMSSMFRNCTTIFPVDNLSTWDITSVTNFQNFMSNADCLSVAQYDALLIGWQQTLETAFPSGVGYTPNIGITFGAAEYTLGGSAEAARNTLINTYGWTITDGGGAFVGVLDTYPNASAAYSLRDLASASVGSAVVRVRRSSDNTEQDFTATEITDGTLATFCSGTDGFVAIWYDQSGNSVNATQATATLQPKLVTSGVIELENGKPCVKYDSTGVVKYLDFTQLTNLFSVYAVGKAGGSSIERFVARPTSITLRSKLGVYDSTPDSFCWFYQGQLFVNGIDGLSPNPDISTTSQHLVVATTTPGGTVPGQSRISDNSYGGRTWRGTMQEIILYNEANNPNRTGIETNINTEYTIY